MDTTHATAPQLRAALEKIERMDRPGGKFALVARAALGPIRREALPLVLAFADAAMLPHSHPTPGTTVYPGNRPTTATEGAI